MRAMWKGNISFGLVNIPVSLFKATEEQKTHFRTLHAECQHPIRYQKWCPRCERSVEAKDLVRGYEYAPESFVLVKDEDIEQLPLPTLHTIEILHFTDKENIDPIYYEKSYYLGPGEYGDKPYKLLFQAMEETGKVAVAKIAFRTREHLAVLRLHQNCLLMNMIHYPAEIRSLEGVPGLENLEQTEVKAEELKIAKKLIEEISEDFHDNYQSDFEQALQSLIATKIEKQEVAKPEAVEPEQNVVDLMEALQKSLKQNKEKAAPKKRGARKKKA